MSDSESDFREDDFQDDDFQDDDFNDSGDEFVATKV